MSVIALSGCGEPRDAIVAEVGEYAIRASSLRNLVAAVLPGQRTDKAGDEARRHYLQILVDGRLLILEARNRGIDTTQAVEKAVREAVDEKVRALYRSKMPAGAPVTEAEMRQFFEREEFDKERELSRIVAPDRASMDRLVEKLKSGEPFEEVARFHSIDRQTAQQGGKLGYVTRPALDMHPVLAKLRIPPDLFQSLAEGEVSVPVPTTGGTWQVVRFTDSRPAEFEKFAVLIEKKLNKQRRLWAHDEHLELLGNTYRARLDRAGLRELMEAYRRRDPGALAASSTPLCHHDQGIITVAEADEVLGAFNLRRAFADSAEADYVIRSYVLGPRLIELAAADEGLYDTPDIREFRKRKRDEVLAEEVRSPALVDIEVSEEEIRQYYDANPGIFRVEGHAQVEELLLPSKAAATEIRARIASGETFTDLVAHSLRSDAQELDAQFHFHRQDRQVYPKLVSAIEAATDGAVTGPVEVEGGYTVFRVLERMPESVQPYAQARRRARGLWLRQRQAEEFDELILQLREKYRTQVVVHVERLTEALPDSLLQG
jgi:peptidyl-prolyl cis-trans isomerase C